MRLTSVRFVLSAMLALGLPATAQAHPVALVLNMQGPALAALVLGAGSVCTTIIYDKNGNRVSVAVATLGGAGTAWGSGTYGCFVWGQ